jgi:hypothetical protein
MAALTPKEMKHSAQIYKTFAYNLQDGPQWTSGLTPLQVVRKAFDSIRSQLSDRYLAEDFDEYLNEEGYKYDHPTTYSYSIGDKPLAWNGLTRIKREAQADQDKLDRAIYEILVGDDSEEEPDGPLETKTVKRSLLGWDDMISGQRLKNGDTVIRLNGDDRFIFEAKGLKEWFRHSETNPLTREEAPPEVRETFILDIEEDDGDAPAEGGRRRKTRKSKKTKRGTRTTRALRVRKTRRNR